ncbi:MAG: FKBP-type peptidyl-prolyl cis-trans isomerase, partial [Micrococcales bacterium]|nr:FKBP-type peptidyl-prolyl cis-trans isomerase [Micrococcales bacterium]
EVVSTWVNGHPEVVRLSDAIDGWQEGLGGQSIGSQVMLIVPPTKAFGAKGTEKVPPDATLVYIIDILAGM